MSLRQGPVHTANCHRGALLVLEYIDDLLYYYKDGYDYDVNWMQACNPVVDVATYFNSIVLGATTKTYGIFYFSHSGAMAKLLARWGLYKDVMAPTASNFAFVSTMEHVSHAKFRRQHGLRLVLMRIERVQSSIVRQRAIDSHSRMRHRHLPLFGIRRHRPAHH